MSNVQKFFEALSKDEVMQEKARTLAEKYKGAQAAVDAVQGDIIILAKSGGYDFTADELTAYTKQDQSLSEEELASAAGGMMVGGFDSGAMQLYALQRSFSDGGGNKGKAPGKDKNRKK